MDISFAEFLELFGAVVENKTQSAKQAKPTSVLGRGWGGVVGAGGGGTEGAMFSDPYLNLELAALFLNFQSYLFNYIFI